ncbi:MAG: tRNA pseudouridine55 synthase [Candidatus Tokpelaia sp. JSC161]|nr:MAG: tRNA pseudouridine55 synthase [Candidatus Tokpelaia sp. JSC161]
MPRQSVSGWLILDKPKGYTSAEAVSRVKAIYSVKKVGHAGTLDPLASGLLPIAIGEATKTVYLIMKGLKIYRFSIAWGEERSTDDLEGHVIKRSLKRPTAMEVKRLLKKYIGFIFQVPPQFSAVRIGGIRAYTLAREGKKIDLIARNVFVKRLDLIGMNLEGHFSFEIECGKGTYVRALARDLGRDLGCYGYIVDLRRIEVCPFKEDNLVTFTMLEKADSLSSLEREKLPFLKKNFAALDSFLLQTSLAFMNIKKYLLSDEQAISIREGCSVLLKEKEDTVFDEVCVKYQEKILAIGSLKHGLFQPKRLFKF